MNKKNGLQLTSILLTISLLVLNSAVFARNKKVEEPAENIQSVQPEVTAEAQGKISEKRRKIISEAVSAIDETYKALLALEEKKTDDAVAALERVTGKLEVILSREPQLTLAPLRVSVVTSDLYASEDAIKKAVKEAEDYLEEGKVQQARTMLSGLMSQITVQVTSIPLATYPAAIKAIIPLIDQGKLEKAKAALEVALNTLVVEEYIFPLPIMRAELLLKKAEALAENRKRTDKESKELTTFIADARTQLDLAKALGYGDKKIHKNIAAQIDEIDKRTKGGKSGHGFFDKIKQSLSDIKRTVIK
ncbi:MAG: YfdX family protein [Methylobacter sp.]|nr:YfdX family protein [Methylobacter sp.]